MQHRFWPVDLILMRDILFHLPPPRSVQALINVNASGSRWFLSTTFKTTQSNPTSEEGYRKLGGWGFYFSVNLQVCPLRVRFSVGSSGAPHPFFFSFPKKLPPYNLDEPELWIEEPAADNPRSVGLWRLPLWTSGTRQPDVGEEILRPFQ